MTIKNNPTLFLYTFSIVDITQTLLRAAGCSSGCALAHRGTVKFERRSNREIPAKVPANEESSKESSSTKSDCDRRKGTAHKSCDAVKMRLLERKWAAARSPVNLLVCFLMIVLWTTQHVYANRE